MKKIAFLLVIATLLFACNEGSDKTSAEDHVHHEAAIAEEQLTLNNGNKWKADSVTNYNVLNLKTMADNFRNKPFPTINDYQVFGSDFNTGLNKMIQECKMKGRDHEALHQWLEPILTESNQIKNSTDTTVAQATFQSIDSRIDAYFKYFE